MFIVYLQRISKNNDLILLNQKSDSIFIAFYNVLIFNGATGMKLSRVLKLQEPTISGGAVDDREMSEYNSGLTNEENGELNSPEREEKRRMLSGKMDEAKMSEYNSDAMDKVIICEDEDYETAEMIGNKMLMHMAAAYQMIDGEGQE